MKQKGVWGEKGVRTNWCTSNVVSVDHMAFCSNLIQNCVKSGRVKKNKTEQHETKGKKAEANSFRWTT